MPSAYGQHLERFMRCELTVFDQVPGGLAEGRLAFSVLRSGEGVDSSRKALAESICKAKPVTEQERSVQDISCFMPEQMQRLR